MKSHLQHLGQMQRVAMRELRDLFLAAEAVGDDQRLVVRFAHGGQQALLAASNRYVVVPTALEAERTGHAATAVLRHLDVHAHLFQQICFRLPCPSSRLLMAMAVDDALRRSCGARSHLPFL